MVLPGLFLSCPSEHGGVPSRDWKDPCTCGWLPTTPPFSGKKGEERLAPLPPYPLLGAGTRGGGYKLCANILPSPQDIFFNKRPWKCQLV